MREPAHGKPEIALIMVVDEIDQAEAAFTIEGARDLARVLALAARAGTRAAMLRKTDGATVQ